MKPIANHADQQQQQAVQIYVAAQQVVVKAQQQLDQLIEYRAEYNTNGISGDTNSTMLRDYQLFLAKINQSIDHAKMNIQHQKQLCELEKLNWLKSRSRSKALEAVIEKYQQNEAQIEARIEQKDQDEHASRIAGLSKRN